MKDNTEYLLSVQHIDGDLLEKAVAYGNGAPDGKKRLPKKILGAAAACLSVCAVLVMIPLFRLPRKPEPKTEFHYTYDKNGFPVYILSEHIYEGEAPIVPEQPEHTEEEKEKLRAAYEKLTAAYPDTAGQPFDGFLTECLTEDGREVLLFSYYLGGMDTGIRYRWTAGENGEEGGWSSEENGFVAFYAHGMTESQYRDIAELLTDQLKRDGTETVGENRTVYLDETADGTYVICEYIPRDPAESGDGGTLPPLYARVNLKAGNFSGDEDPAETGSEESAETGAEDIGPELSAFNFRFRDQTVYTRKDHEVTVHEVYVGGEKAPSGDPGGVTDTGLSVSEKLFADKDPPTLYVIYPVSASESDAAADRVIFCREEEEREMLPRLWKRNGDGTLEEAAKGDGIYSRLYRHPGEYYLIADISSETQYNYEENKAYCTVTATGIRVISGMEEDTVYGWERAVDAASGRAVRVDLLPGGIQDQEGVTPEVFEGERIVYNDRYVLYLSSRSFEATYIRIFDREKGELLPDVLTLPHALSLKKESRYISYEDGCLKIYRKYLSDTATMEYTVDNCYRISESGGRFRAEYQAEETGDYYRGRKYTSPDGKRTAFHLTVNSSGPLPYTDGIYSETGNGEITPLLTDVLHSGNPDSCPARIRVPFCFIDNDRLLYSVEGHAGYIGYGIYNFADGTFAEFCEGRNKLLWYDAPSGRLLLMTTAETGVFTYREITLTGEEVWCAEGYNSKTVIFSDGCWIRAFGGKTDIFSFDRTVRIAGIPYMFGGMDTAAQRICHNGYNIYWLMS